MKTGASEGVKLVERVRLGERPDPVDWALAAAILALADAAERFEDAVRDLIEDREKSSNKARFIVRAHLVAEFSRILADAAAVARKRLSAYFAHRTTEDDSEPTEGEESGPEDHDTTAAYRPVTEAGSVLEAGGVSQDKAGAIGNAIEEVRAECGWLSRALDALVSSKPSDDEVLDFLSELEARFAEDLFSLQIKGRQQFLAAALDEAVARA
jgi:hypothetical protein